MAESKKPGDLMSIFIQKAIDCHIKTIESRFIIIAVHDDEEKSKTLKSVTTASHENSIRNAYVFDNVDECFEFIIDKVSLDPLITIVILAGGGLVCDLVSTTHTCSQVSSIIIMSKPPFKVEEHELMKTYDKVKCMADIEVNEKICYLDQFSSTHVIQQTKFSEPLSYELVNNKETDKETPQYEEPIERSCKQINGDLFLRFYLLMCLRNVPPFPSDKSDLIKLFETNNWAAPSAIKTFQETYLPNNAILYYTKESFIFHSLNKALRTRNTHHLLSFRFIFQDICDQMNELNAQDEDNQTIIVYRGQIANSYEMADLFLAYCQKSAIMTTAFFSTSKNKEQALGFIFSSIGGLFGTDPSVILFKITARKQDALSYFPFADISKVSQFPKEKEVLFAPGQLFNIDNFDIIFENNRTIFVFEMTLKNESEKIPATLKSIWRSQTNPLLFLGKLLTENQLYNEANELYNRLLFEYDDLDEKYACYHGLYGVALAQGDENRAMILDQKMTQLKFGIQLPSTDFVYESIGREDSAKISAATEKVKKACSQMSINRPFNQLIPYIMGTEFLNDVNQILDSVYPMVNLLIKNGVYDQAIIILEKNLSYLQLFNSTPSDPCFIPRCYMQLGHCYRELKLNEKAVKNYELALEQDIRLPFDEYIETLIRIGMVWEAMKNFEQALNRYIEVAEIYQRDSIISDPGKIQFIEECIKRVTDNCTKVD
ncbi:unnamed protein product [Rotaria socialis]|uniref:ADP ribosyltransferase domain-containing protein n=2 Tax=Rotaria socialis TaxID=392032 RepID=A0A821R9A2_9BILA|nr:unnamed protein product [Rotaria socialis]CAF3397744.1 unnamed protein product [Rotaria socialis]CAF4609229.1 unnamed protein product [Rotaria socialis]CAF4838467.1 unnamed protein product [Rotaria socialis]